MEAFIKLSQLINLPLLKAGEPSYILTHVETAYKFKKKHRIRNRMPQLVTRKE